MSTNFPGRPVAPLAASLVGAGSVTSPGVNAAIASAGNNWPVGLYDVELWWSITGTAETQPLNMQLAVNGGGSPVTTALPSLPGVYRMSFTAEVIAAGSPQVWLRSQAAATAGAVYTAILRATRIR
jgi:hypothetical protein